METKSESENWNSLSSVFSVTTLINFEIDAPVAVKAFCMNVYCLLRMEKREENNLAFFYLCLKSGQRV